jgi:hypothetical protein
MGTRSNPTFGMLLIDTRLTPDTEVAQGGTSVQSSYTQAGPIPGTPDPGDNASSWRPQISAAQSVDVTALVLRGGYPGRTGAGISVKITSDANTYSYRGWNEPNLVDAWTAPDTGYVAAAAWDRLYACVIPDTQEIVLVATGTGATARSWYYNPRSETWTDGATFSVTQPVLSNPVAIVYDEERDYVVLWSGDGASGDPDTLAMYSSDKGATWTRYARGVWDQTTTGQLSVAAQKGRAWCAFWATGGTADQYYSIDHGVTWTRVVSSTTLIGSGQCKVVALKSGAYLVVYLDTSDFVKARKIESASDSFEDATAVAILGGMDGTKETIAVAVDADGAVYVFAAAENAGLSDGDDLGCAVSYDEGATWTTYDWLMANNGTGTIYPGLHCAVAAAGQIHLPHIIVGGDAAIGDSLGMFSLGGWANVEQGVGTTAAHGDRSSRMGYGRYIGSATVSADAYLWWPADQPEAMGWTKVGAGATGALTTAVGLELSVADSYYRRTWTHADAQRYTSGSAWVQRVSGGSSTTNDIAIRLRSSDATYEYIGEIRILSNTVTVNDYHGASATSVVGLDSDSGIHLRWIISQNLTGCALSVWARPAGSSEFTRVVSKLALTNTAGAPAGTDAMEWGHITANAAGSVWRIAGYSPDGDWRHGFDTAPQLDDPDATTTGYLGMDFGKAIPSRAAEAYPLPFASTSSEDCARISATGGPAHFAETTSLPTAYTRAMRNVYPTLSPSPTRFWESTSTSENRIVWDITDDSWFGDALGLVVIGGYGRQVELSYDNGGAGWTVAGTLDLSLSAGTALNCTRAGTSVVPRAGTSTVGRYIQEGELVGGYGILSAGAGFVARVIRANSGGYWRAGTGAEQLVRVDFEEVDGTEDAAGTVDLIAPSGVLVVYLTAVTARHRWRVRWAASQTTPGSVFRAGIVGVGRVVGLGAEPGWDWRRQLELQRTITRDRAGVPYVQQRGKPRMTWTYGWPDGLALRKLRDTQSADYVGISGGLPLGSAEDPWWAWAGHITRTLDSGAVPCVLLPKLQTATGSITDPSLFHYGLLTSETVGVTSVVGTEGTDEIVRLDGVTFEGLPRS